MAARDRRPPSRRLTLIAAALLIVTLAGAAALVQPWLWGWQDRLASAGRRLIHPRDTMRKIAERLNPPADPADTPFTDARRPTIIGVNLVDTRAGNNSPTFANLVIAAPWQVMHAGRGWRPAPTGTVTSAGELTGRPSGGLGFVRLIYPVSTGPEGAVFHCRWRGTGTVTVGGAARTISSGAHDLSFRRTVVWPEPQSVSLVVRATDPADPVRQVDCRRADVAESARFDPDFVGLARRFRILRFMDWQRTNELKPVRWATRVKRGDPDTGRPGGVAIEDMIALTAETGADPWFTIPWEADDDYVRRFATLVRDTLPAGARVHVELANEVWNRQFPVTAKAAQEGFARGLSASEKDAALLRYGERVIHVMGIWREVFRGREERLVRIASVQHKSAGAAAKLLGFRDLAAHVDALATAPYFGEVVASPDTTDRTVWFQRLDASIDRTLHIAAAHRATAERFGKRYLAYEGGQHVVMKSNEPLMNAINRDPRMGLAYRRYLDLWRAHIGDAFIHYSSVRRNNRHGAWGLTEYPGQPLDQAPKLRAVLEAARQH